MINYRKDIDGLRGLSIILVLLFHAKIPFFSGGFLGVDIFFVISGYLITSIIIKLHKKKKFEINYFYERRIRRIIPALYIVLIFLSVYTFFFQSPYFSKDLSQSIFFTPIFLQNFLNIYESSQYFNLAYDFKSLGHTWSLSIEEQFYMIYPIFFLLVLKFFKTYLRYFISLLFIISLIYYLYLGLDGHQQNLLFFFTPSRIWEILSGCIVALNFTKVKKPRIINLVALILIIFPIFFINIIDLQYVLRILVVIGASLLLIETYNVKECPISKLLKTKYLVFIGIISYSLYLWHVPIYSIYRDFFTFEQNVYENLFLITLSILISYISFKFVETPFRNSKKINRKLLYSCFFSGIIFFTSFGVIGHKLNGFEEIKSNNLPIEKKDFYISFMHEREKLSKFKKIPKNTNNNHILVIGDSLANDVVNSLSTQEIFSERLILNGPCFSKLIDNLNACGIDLDLLLKKSLNASRVILSSDFVNEKSQSGALKLYKFLKKNNINTNVVGSLNFKYISSSSYRFAKYNFYNEHRKFYFKNIQPNVSEVDKFLKDNIAEDYIEKLNFFCDTKIRECEIYDEYSKPLFYDTKHLTVHGLSYFGKYLKNFL